MGHGDRFLVSHPPSPTKSSDFEREKLSFFLLEKTEWVYYGIRESDS